MNPEIFNIFGFSIRWYSVLILTGIVVAYLLANKEAQKHKLPKDYFLNVIFYAVIFGILGARIYYVLFNLDYYLANPLEIFAIWNGGLAIHGGIIVGFITMVIYCHKNKTSILETTDISVISLIIAQAIGRWGNFFNSEAHGPITTLQTLTNLKIIPKFIIKGMYINHNYYHPTFYYESLWCLIGFIILILIRKLFKDLKKGTLTSIYLIWYGIGRFLIESLRTDALMLGNLRIAQLISLLFIVIGIILLIYINIKKKESDSNAR